MPADSAGQGTDFRSRIGAASAGLGPAIFMAAGSTLFAMAAMIFLKFMANAAFHGPAFRCSGPSMALDRMQIGPVASCAEIASIPE